MANSKLKKTLEAKIAHREDQYHEGLITEQEYHDLIKGLIIRLCNLKQAEYENADII